MNLTKNFNILFFTLILTGFSLSLGSSRRIPSSSSAEKKPTIVSAWYHHWWYQGRFAGDRENYKNEPLLGKYVISDDTVKTHATWAKNHGINTFGLDVWIDPSNKKGWVDKHNDIVARVLDSERMNYFFLIDRDLSNGGWQKYNSQQIAAETVEVIKPYYNRNQYLKVDGKPVIFFWAAYNTDCDFWRDVRAGIEGQLGPITLAADLKCADIRMLYNPYLPTKGNHKGQNARQKDLWKDWSGDRRPWVPTTLAGYDDHKAREGNPALPLDAEGFRTSIQNALTYDQRMKNGEKWLMINSWNEWHEGSQIEPSKDFADPFIFLKVLKEELDKLD